MHMKEKGKPCRPPASLPILQSRVHVGGACCRCSVRRRLRVLGVCTRLLRLPLLVVYRHDVEVQAAKRPSLFHGSSGNTILAIRHPPRHWFYFHHESRREVRFSTGRCKRCFHCYPWLASTWMYRSRKRCRSSAREQVDMYQSSATVENFVAGQAWGPDESQRLFQHPVWGYPRFCTNAQQNLSSSTSQSLNSTRSLDIILRVHGIN